MVLVGGNFTVQLLCVKHVAPLYETLSAIARLGCYPTFRALQVRLDDCGQCHGTLQDRLLRTWRAVCATDASSAIPQNPAEAKWWGWKHITYTAGYHLNIVPAHTVFSRTLKLPGLNTVTNMVAKVTNMAAFATKTSMVVAKLWHYTLLKHRLQTLNATMFLPNFEPWLLPHNLLSYYRTCLFENNTGSIESKISTQFPLQPVYSSHPFKYSIAINITACHNVVYNVQYKRLYGKSGRHLFWLLQSVFQSQRCAAYMPVGHNSRRWGLSHSLFYLACSLELLW